MRGRAALLALFVAIPAAATFVQAQVPGAPLVATTVTVEIQNPNGPPIGVMVPGRPYALQVNVNYQYGQGALQPTGPTQIDLTLVGAPPWMQAHLNKSTLFLAINQTGTVSGSTATNITAIDSNLTLEAPAFLPANVTIVARARANGNLAASEGQSSRTFLPGFIPLLSATISPDPIQMRGSALLAPGGIPTQVRLVVENGGNGPELVNVSLASAPQGTKVTLPPPFVVGSKATGQSSKAIVFFTVVNPWTNAPRGEIGLKIDFTHATRIDSVGEPKVVAIDLVGSTPVPALEPAIVVVALLGGLAFVRRPAVR